MPRASAQAWWADVEDVRERIERRRALEERHRPRQPSTRRTVSITGHPSGEAVPLDRVDAGEDQPPMSLPARRRPPRSVTDHLGNRPDRIAGWAVFFGFTVVLITILTSHG